MYIRIQIPLSAVTFKGGGEESACIIEVIAALRDELGYPKGENLVHNRHNGRFEAVQLKEWLASSGSTERQSKLSVSIARSLASARYDMVVLIRQPSVNKMVARRLNSTIQGNEEAEASCSGVSYGYESWFASGVYGPAGGPGRALVR